MSDTKLQNLVKDSGMVTHLRAVDCLREHGWSVNIGTYYYDNVADAVREIDVVAEKRFESATRGRSSVELNVQLFIECKYLNNEVLFWSEGINRNKALEKVEQMTGLRIVEVRHSGDILPDKFHYLENRQQKVAKLFSTNSNKEDVIYKAVSQCLRAQVYHEQWVREPIAIPFNDHAEVQTKIVRYPIAVLSSFDTVYEALINTKTAEYSTVPVTRPFLLETNYVYLNNSKSVARDDYILIDMVSLDTLGNWLVSLDAEAGAIVAATIK